MDWNFYLNDIFPVLNRGLRMSLALILPSATLGLAGGFVLGMARAFGPSWLRKAGDVYTALFRGVPLVVQLFMLYYALPRLGLYLDGFSAAVLGFTLCSAAYHSEYVRGAALSVKQGQFRAAQALGMSPLQTALYVLAPQTMRRALPGCGNEIVYLIKYSSLAYLTTCVELTGEAKVLASQTYRYPEIFMAAGVYYLALTSLASLVLGKIEKRLRVPGFGRTI
ncbi:MAG: amino acid ABC transporter permease [Deltaproteobacteria bacterium]|jgi:polar amino acid transport system permease protein|nr:amino acid ABC transporter permease [Deltaproteobacteria bacterium]